MGEEIDILLSMTDSLLKTTLEAYNFDNGPYYDHVYLEINKIIEAINKSEFKNVFELPRLRPSEYYTGGTRNDLMKAVSVLRQISSFLDTVLGKKALNLEKLAEKNKKLNEEILNYKDKEKDYLEIIKNSRNKSDYTIEDEKLKKFNGNNLKLISEALDSYSVGAYTACICVCRNILQDLVQKICKENKISEGSLGSQIESLVANKIIKSNQHSLIDSAKFFGHRAAHPTTEIFNKEKANLVLSALFIINEEIFNTSN